MRPGRQRLHGAPWGRGRLLVESQDLMDAEARAPGRRTGCDALRLVAAASVGTGRGSPRHGGTFRQDGALFPRHDAHDGRLYLLPSFLAYATRSFRDGPQCMILCSTQESFRKMLLLSNRSNPNKRQGLAANQLQAFRIPVDHGCIRRPPGFITAFSCRQYMRKCGGDLRHIHWQNDRKMTF